MKDWIKRHKQSIDISTIGRPISKKYFNEYEKYYKELDQQTKNGKPSDRIKFLVSGSLQSIPNSEWIKAILNYLDEQYESKTK